MLKLEIESINHNGEGVARNAGKVFFIPETIPGEKIEAEEILSKKNYSRAVLKKILSQSPHRVKPRCLHYHQCGGCSYQHVDYPYQLRLKQQIIENAFFRVGGIQLETKPILGMTQPWFYRNKVLWHITKISNVKKIGFYQIRSRKLVEIINCPLLSPSLVEISKMIRENIDHIELENQASVMIRETEKGQKIQVEFIDCIPGEIFLENLAKEVSSIYIKHNQETRLLSGERKIKGKIGQCWFYSSPDDFLQINALQNEKLVQIVSDDLRLSQSNSLLDLYCGIGMFALNFAEKTSGVLGIDLNHQAIVNAKKNARINNIKNSKFISGKCEQILPKIKRSFDRIIVDPPRTGLQPELVREIIKRFPERLVYVSCDPATLARDIRAFLENGYRVKSIQPVDMFPQTSHIENVVLLQLD